MELCGKNLIVYDSVNFGSLRDFFFFFFRHANSGSRDAKTLVRTEISQQLFYGLSSLRRYCTDNSDKHVCRSLLHKLPARVSFHAMLCLLIKTTY